MNISVIVLIALEYSCSIHIGKLARFVTNQIWFWLTKLHQIKLPFYNQDIHKNKTTGEKIKLNKTKFCTQAYGVYKPDINHTQWTRCSSFTVVFMYPALAVVNVQHPQTYLFWYTLSKPCYSHALVSNMSKIEVGIAPWLMLRGYN